MFPNAAQPDIIRSFQKVSIAGDWGGLAVSRIRSLLVNIREGACYT